MTSMRNVYAVLPIKETTAAKNRLAGAFSAGQRRQLALAMATDVLKVLAKVRELAGILVVTNDPEAVLLAGEFAARISDERASDGHTAVVNACAQRLAVDQFGMLALPSDIPLVQVEDIQKILSAGRESPTFVIVPAHDEQGSNAIFASPADAVPLRFGENSFFPHLAAARARGINPVVLNCPSIALDIDTPADVARFMSIPSRTNSRALLEDWGMSMQSAAVLQTGQA